MSTAIKSIIVVIVLAVITFVLGALIGNRDNAGGVNVETEYFNEGVVITGGAILDTISASGDISLEDLTASGDVTSGDDFIVSSTSGTSTLTLGGSASCFQLKATNGSTTAFIATSSASGLIQIASCNNP